MVRTLGTVTLLTLALVIPFKEAAAQDPRSAVQFLEVRPALSLAASQVVAGVQPLGQELVRPPAP
jgi:hypothetical protein